MGDIEKITIHANQESNSASSKRLYPKRGVERTISVQPTSTDKHRRSSQIELHKHNINIFLKNAVFYSSHC